MTQSNENVSPHVVATDTAIGIVPVKDRKPITVIGNNSIRVLFVISRDVWRVEGES